MTEKDTKRYWERREGGKSSALMMVFIITIIVMLVVVTVMAGYGYAKYQEWARQPQIHVERSLFEFHDDVYEEQVNITAHVYLRNRGDKDTGPLELEWLIMPADRAADNIYIFKGRKEVESMKVDETMEITFDLRLPTGEYRIAFRTYEEDYFGYEGRQSLTVGEEDVEERAGADDEKWTEEAVPSLSFFFVILITLITTIIWRKRR